MALHKHFLLQSTFDHPQKCIIAKCQIAHLDLICPPERGRTLRAAEEGFWTHPGCLETKPCSFHCRLTADMWCVALDGFSVLPGWVCTDPQHPTELLCSQAPQLGWQLHRDGLGSAQNWIKGSLELGRNQRREGKNRRRKGSLTSYDSVSSVLAEQQIGIKEGNPTAVQKKWRKKSIPLFNYSQVLDFLIPSLLA